MTIIKQETSSRFSSRAETVDPQALALSALGWILNDPPRAERLLDLTGLTPDALRGGLGEPAVLASVLEFLANHEPDLIAAAEALDTSPEALIEASKRLNA